MDAQTAFRMRKLAMEDGKVIEFRPVSKRVVELREQGHPAKPVNLKMKTIEDIDVELGAAAGEVGMVGYFQPKMPWYLKDLPLEHQNRLRARYTKRLDEYDNMAKQVAELESKGAIHRVGNTIADESGTPYTGDYDPFSITEPDMVTAVPDYWKKMGSDVEHGPHLDWDVPGGSAEQFADIVMRYRPKGGGEKLIRFNPDGSIVYGTFKD